MNCSKAKKKILFVSCNDLKKRVGRSVNFFFSLFFWSKMFVLCMFYVDLELGGLYIFRVGIFLNTNLLG